MHELSRLRRLSVLLGFLLASGAILVAPALGENDSWVDSPQRAFLESPIVRKYQCVTCHTITDEGGTHWYLQMMEKG